MDTHTQLLPRARHDRLVIEEIGDELLIYDTANDRAHTLNRTAALVWKLCDGKRSVGEIALAVGKELQQPLNEQTVWYALGKLDEYRLLAEPILMPQSMAGISRREFLTKFAVAAAVVPVVKSLRIPVAGGEISCLPHLEACIDAPLPCCTGLTCCGGGQCLFECPPP